MNSLQLHTNRNFGLDLCRCIAVCMVLFVHTGQLVFHQAFTFLWYLPIGGVELFFSLSGFLIGRILLRLFDQDDVGIKDVGKFWLQRWFRTLPLYYILYFVYLLRDNLFLQPVPFNPKYLLFLQNFTGPPPDFFGESATLSIEEWFYITAPILTLGFFHAGNTLRISFLQGKKAYVATAVLLILSSILLRWQFLDTGKFIAVSVIFRLDAIAYGLLAAYLSKKVKDLPNRKAALMLATGIVLWSAAAIIRFKFFFGVPEQSYYICSGTGTALIVWGLYYLKFGIQPYFVSFISRISYSIYLVHLTGIAIPFYYFFNEEKTSAKWLLFFLALGLTIGLATLTYHLIEKPFLSLRRKFFREKSTT